MRRRWDNRRRIATSLASHRTRATHAHFTAEVSATPSSIERGLLADIEAQPLHAEPRLVYADWLQSEGDPRGELIVVQHARRSRPDDPELVERERELVEVASLLLVRHNIPREAIARWHLGFVEELALTGRVVHVLERQHPAWLDEPALRVVGSISLSAARPRGLHVLGRAPLARTVQRLQIGSITVPLDRATLAAISRTLPLVSSLHVRSTLPPAIGGFELQLIDLRFDVDTLDRETIRALLAAPWRLRDLALAIRPERWPPAVGQRDRLVDELMPLLHGAVMRDIRQLVLPGFAPVATMLDALARSGRARTLSSLCLDFQRLTYQEIDDLAEHGEALRHLRLQPACDNVATYHRLARLYRALDRREDAVTMYGRVQRRAPWIPGVKEELAALG